MELDRLCELLSSKDLKTLLRAVEKVGSLALKSESSNSQIVARKQILSSLVELVDSRIVKLSSAAINAVVDLAITLAARQALLECGLLNRFLGLFDWLADSVATSSWKKDFQELLELALITVDGLMIDHPGDVPQDFFFNVFTTIRKIWVRSRADFDKRTRNILAKVLSRIVMEHFEAGFETGSSQEELTFIRFSQHFLIDHWEKAPSITKGPHNFIDLFLKQFPVQDLPQLLFMLVESSVTCPPACNDELDSRRVFEEMKDSLGDRIAYKQDIRLVRCSSSSETEEYYSSYEQDQAVCFEDCIKAFEQGYTVAIRGMESRSPLLAAFSECLRLETGQASIGVNLYLTPSNAQGLSVHYDDHCVFVLQVAGEKKWSLYKPANNLLPRLYQPVTAPEFRTQPPMNVLLGEGRMLYIPRGFPHRAVSSSGKRKRTVTEESSSPLCFCSSDDSAPSSSKFDRLSLHLTFGVEVEAPFTWEGFVHVAFHNWHLRQEFSQTRKGRAYKIILHFALRIEANAVREFQEACSVAMPSVDESSNARKFQQLINILSASPTTYLIGRAREMMIKGAEHDDSLDWLRHLDANEMFFDSYNDALDFNLNDSSVKGDYGRDAIDGFVREAVSDQRVYAGARKGFLSLLEQYRTSRRKTMNAMLALH